MGKILKRAGPRHEATLVRVHYYSQDMKEHRILTTCCSRLISRLSSPRLQRPSFVTFPYFFRPSRVNGLSPEETCTTG
jgi:hypothetical protein